ncbi:hypothetical protein F5X71_09795 [Nocardia brasiliensis]|uniref:Uncharacterized protein n=1 Tax=Nocardia brasiliensis TaxID=37326 RepID=A0A6G9XNS8_NOCBR|nr:hypothetical protein [Nocardia brasiliensis]QIS02575.1 hypothetical protein F5X71_09795 [Nocardia brasiliensis]
MIADPAAADMSVNNQFFAADHAHVGQQIGTQHNFVEHKETIYHTSPDDSPDQMHIVARAHLDGGNPRAAEDILRTLHHKGHATPERAYLYVLSILSDRSYGDVTAEQTNEIENATRVVAGEGPGEWQDALDVVNRLLRYAHAEYSEGAVDDEFATALTMFGALSVGRQDEIDTHLSRIVSGAVHEKLAAKRKYQVAEQRMSADRIGRAWKFFEADPLPPGLWVTAPMPATTVDWRDAILGSMATVAAMTVMLTGEITAVLVLVLPLVVAGFFVAVRCMTVWQTHSRYVRSVLAHREPQPDQLEGRFDRLIDQCFREGNHVHLWESSEGYRGYLKRRLQCQYGPYQCHPFELQWLIRWHASRIGRGYDYPTARPADAQRAANSRIFGAMAWLVALVASALAGGFWAFVGAFPVRWTRRR